jgi:hypothetical protein
MRVKLTHHGHDIEALASRFANGEWGVEVTVEWLEGIVEKGKKFGLPYGIFPSQNDAESWGLLAALRWIEAGKPDTEALVTIN